MSALRTIVAFSLSLAVAVGVAAGIDGKTRQAIGAKLREVAGASVEVRAQILSGIESELGGEARLADLFAQTGTAVEAEAEASTELGLSVAAPPVSGAVDGGLAVEHEAQVDGASTAGLQARLWAGLRALFAR